MDNLTNIILDLSDLVDFYNLELEDFLQFPEDTQHSNILSMFTFEDQEECPLSTAPSFEKTISNASIVRLVSDLGIDQISSKSVHIIRRIIEIELYKVLKTSLIFRDQRDAKILQVQDVINALHFLDVKLPLTHNIK
jgi:hypothetical protein